MPETGELHHYIDWLKEKIGQYVHYVAIAEGERLDSKSIDKAISIEKINDFETGRRLGVHVRLEMERWPENVRNQVVKSLNELVVPGVITREGHHNENHWHIIGDITSSEEVHCQYYHDGHVKPLVKRIMDFFDAESYNCVSDTLLSERINLMASKVNGADGSKITISKAPNDESFDLRIAVSTTDTNDPLWQKLIKELQVVQQQDFCGTDLRWHRPFEFIENEESIPVSVIGPLPAIRKVFDSVSGRLIPALTPLGKATLGF